MTFLACHRLLVPASALALTAAALICSGCGSSSSKETAGLDSGTDGRGADEESGGGGTEAGGTEPDGGVTGVGPNEEAGTDGGQARVDAGPSVSTVFTMD